MNFNEFCDAIDATTVNDTTTTTDDLRPKLKAVVKLIVERELAHVTEAFAKELAASRLGALAAQAGEALSRGDIVALDTMVGAFELGLRNAVIWECTSEQGRLRPRHPEDEIRTFTYRFEEHGWNGFEADCVLQRRNKDECIVAVGFREIRTSVRVITRDDFDGLRPVSIWPVQWRRCYTPENRIREVEDIARCDAAYRALPFRYFAAPAPEPRA